jgi:hypothetical protein
MLNVDKSIFGRHSISWDLYKFIESNFDENNIMLEIGSGRTTKVFNEMFKGIYSIEDSKTWAFKYHKNYLHVPLIKYNQSERLMYFQNDLIRDINKAWYDVEKLKQELKKYNDYTFILMDGPGGIYGRYGFTKNLDIFNGEVPIIFDDVNREEDMINYNDTLTRLNKTGKVFKCSDGQMFGVVNWESLPDIKKYKEVTIEDTE